MKRVLSVTGVFMALLGAAVLCASYCSSRQPSYAGRTLQEWLDAQAYQDTIWWPGRVATSNAIFSMGTNAIPFLIDKFSRGPDKRSRFKDHVFGTMYQLGFKHQAIRFYDTYGQERMNAVWEAFTDLRPYAKDAAPVIIDIYKRGDLYHREASLFALGELGAHDALPFLLEEIKTNYGPERAGLYGAIGDIHPEANIAIPVLLNGLRSTNLQVRIVCASGLDTYGPEAQQTIGDLIRLLNDLDRGLKTEPYSVVLRPAKYTAERALTAISGFKTNADSH